MPALQAVTHKKTEDLTSKGLMRVLATDNRDDFPYIKRQNRILISFSCNDYLGLSKHPAVIDATQTAINKYGVGAGASRLVTGNYPLYNELEKTLAKMKKTDAACVFGSGYLANIGILPALMSRDDLVVADKLVHACVHDGVKIAGSEYKRFEHNNLESLERILSKHRKNHTYCLLVTETVFSMDGDVAPVAEIIELAKKYDCWVMTDDAHGFGVVESCNDADIQMGTLSKSAGVYGGYVCASEKIINYIKTSARSLMYSTALPPSVVAAAIESCRIIKTNKELCRLPLKKAKLFTSILAIEEAQSAIVPIILGDEQDSLDAASSLEQDGFLVSAIRPPTVPKNTSRLRFTFSALHDDTDIERLAAAVKERGIL